MGICSVVQLQHKNVVMATMDLLKIVLKHLSLSFILHPKIPLIFFLHRSLIALYLRQDVCHLWQHVIKFRSPLMTPAGARIAQWWKLLFITRIKPVRFVFLTLAFYSFDSQWYPFKKALCPQIKKRKTDHSELMIHKLVRICGLKEGLTMQVQDIQKHSHICGPHTYLKA